MRAAMEAVSGGKMNTNAAAKSFGVPRKTLGDRMKGKVRHGTKPGATTVWLRKSLYLITWCIWLRGVFLLPGQW